MVAYMSFPHRLFPGALDGVRETSHVKGFMDSRAPTNSLGDRLRGNDTFWEFPLSDSAFLRQATRNDTGVRF